MRNRKMFSAAVLSAILAASVLAGCGSSGAEPDKPITGVTTGAESGTVADEQVQEETHAEEAAESAVSVEAPEETANNEGSEVSIEEQVLFEGEGIKITAKGLEDDLFGTKLALLIENDSDRCITVQAQNANVNGYMVTTMMSADVAAGKKANDGLIFETSGLKECGIEQIANMEFRFHIFDTNSWEDILNTDVIKIDTSIAEGYEQTYDDSGEVLVDANNIKIVGKGISSEDSIFGPGLILYIENNSDRDVTIQASDVSVNGFMTDSLMSEDVVAHKKAISAVTFLGASLEENQIEDITDVELTFHIVDLSTWETVFDSETIAVHF